MEILTQRTFDIFRYILPGVLVIGAFLIGKTDEIVHPDQIIEYFVDGVQQNRVIFLIILSYIVGIAHEQLCSIIIVELKISDISTTEYKSNSKYTTVEKLCLVRHISPGNLREIERWNMLKGMCINVSGFLVYLSVCSLYKLFHVDIRHPWLILAALAGILSHLIFQKSRTYYKWALQDLDSTFDLIQNSKISAEAIKTN